MNLGNTLALFEKLFGCFDQINRLFLSLLEKTISGFKVYFHINNNLHKYSPQQSFSEILNNM